MTIHRVVEAPKPNQAAEQLEQVLPYIGGQGKGAGRRFSIRSGIIGRAVRDAAPYTFIRQTDDYDAFINVKLSASGNQSQKIVRRVIGDGFRRCAYVCYTPIIVPRVRSSTIPSMILACIDRVICNHRVL